MIARSGRHLAPGSLVVVVVVVIGAVAVLGEVGLVDSIVVVVVVIDVGVVEVGLVEAIVVVVVVIIVGPLAGVVADVIGVAAAGIVDGGRPGAVDATVVLLCPAACVVTRFGVVALVRAGAGAVVLAAAVVSVAVGGEPLGTGSDAAILRGPALRLVVAELVAVVAFATARVRLRGALRACVGLPPALRLRAIPAHAATPSTPALATSTRWRENHKAGPVTAFEDSGRPSRSPAATRSRAPRSGRAV